MKTTNCEYCKFEEAPPDYDKCRICTGEHSQFEPKSSKKASGETVFADSPLSCVWAEDTYGWWHTGCGNTFMFTEGGPEENHADYCLYCGKQIKTKCLGEPNG